MLNLTMYFLFCFTFLYCSLYHNLWLALFHYHKSKIENDAFDYRYGNIAKGRKKKKTKEDMKRELLNSVKNVMTSMIPVWTRLMLKG